MGSIRDKTPGARHYRPSRSSSLPIPCPTAVRFSPNLAHEDLFDGPVDAPREQPRDARHLRRVAGELPAELDAGPVAGQLDEAVLARRQERARERVHLRAPPAHELRRAPRRVVGPRQHGLAEDGARHARDLAAALPRVHHANDAVGLLALLDDEAPDVRQELEQLREPVAVRLEDARAREREGDVGLDVHRARVVPRRRRAVTRLEHARAPRNQRPAMARPLAALAALALLVVAGCGDDARPPCAAGGAACPPEAPADPRFVGPGMRSGILPHWPMFRHDGQHDGRSPIAPPSLGTLRWSFRTDGEIWSSPAVGLDGTVYVGSLDHRLYAVSPAGKLEWSFETLAYIFSSPAVAGDGTVYVGSVDAHLYAVRGGRMKWAVPLENCAFSSPTLAQDGTVYVGSNAWKVEAVTPDGRVRWIYQAKAPISTTPVILPNGLVVAGSDDANLYAIRPDGTEAGHFETRGPVRSSAAVAGDGTIYVGSDDGQLYAFAPRGGLRWAFAASAPIQSSPAVAPDGTIVVGASDKSIYGIWPNGRLRWRVPTGAAVASSPAIAADGTAYVGCDDGSVYAVGPNGDVRWTFRTGGTVFSSPAIAPDGTVYVGSADGRLYALR